MNANGDTRGINRRVHRRSPELGEVGWVFAVLILGYVVAVPAYKRITYLLSWERKRDIARSRNHIIEAALLK